jgi:hypothetical protein
LSAVDSISRTPAHGSRGQTRDLVRRKCEISVGCDTCRRVDRQWAHGQRDKPSRARDIHRIPPATAVSRYPCCAAGSCAPSHPRLLRWIPALTSSTVGNKLARLTCPCGLRVHHIAAAQIRHQNGHAYQPRSQRHATFKRHERTDRRRSAHGLHLGRFSRGHPRAKRFIPDSPIRFIHLSPPALYAKTFN